MIKLLVANRGEIACRIFETCRIKNIHSIAIYAADDSTSRHVKMADSACLLEGNTLHQTYLNAEQIIKIAKREGATLIHPGYGFLSEKAEFAKAVQNAGLTWIGPNPDVIEKMGSKIEAKILAEKAEVPTLPWAYFKNKKDQTEAEYKKAAKKIGYPLLVKASGGGGGRGMRRINQEAELIEGIKSAEREAAGAFADATIFLEKMIESARHIEVQLLGDHHNNIVHLFDRECSVQRRHQKIIEEAPAPRLTPKTQKALREAAVRLGKNLNYQGVGTIEFLVDADENFYFLEMNTRLQVEHPVTEMITGLDLVACQIDVALQNKLPFTQKQIESRGHAIECRICAEDPTGGFMPTPGPIKKLVWPLTRHTRIDTGVFEGQILSSSYDPMIAKLSTWGATRVEATEQMEEAINQTTLLGLTHNLPFLQFLLKTEEWKNSAITTNWIEKEKIADRFSIVTEDNLKKILQVLLTQKTNQRSTETKMTISTNLFEVIHL